MVCVAFMVYNLIRFSNTFCLKTKNLLVTRSIAISRHVHSETCALSAVNRAITYLYWDDSFVFIHCRINTVFFFTICNFFFPSLWGLWTWQHAHLNFLHFIIINNINRIWCIFAGNQCGIEGIPVENFSVIQYYFSSVIDCSQPTPSIL